MSTLDKRYQRTHTLLVSNAPKAYRITIRRNGRTVLSLHLSGLSSALRAVRRLRGAWQGYAIHLARV